MGRKLPFFYVKLFFLKKSFNFILLIKKIALYLQCNNQVNMKYSELEKKLKKAGCYDIRRQMNGHPLWYSPITGLNFKMSNHKSEEIAKGTLKAISKQSGVKL